MPVRAEHVGAHGGRWAKLGKPASKMAHTYQIHVQYSAFSEKTYDNSTKYWPTVLGIFQTDQIRPFIDIHLGKQFILALNLLKVTRVEAIFKISVDFAEKNRKKWRDFVYGLKIELPNYGNQR